jgi:PTS system nitrogen regulatory IIA component
MKFSELINKNYIIPEFKGSTKKQVLEELVEALASNNVEIDKVVLLNALLEREKLGSTGIGDGVAIPHGKLNGLDNIILLFGKSGQGVDFDAIDRKPVRMVFLLVAPADSAGLHLKALARLSRMLREKEFKNSLLMASDAETLLKIIIDKDENLSS